jgi:tRNA A37 methylthiotransferase MiaB
MRIYIEAYGCKRRKLDYLKIVRYLRVNGYEVTESPNRGDVVLLVTCAFNREEEEAALRRMENLRHQEVRLIVYGCLPDIAPSKIGVDRNTAFLPTREIDKIDRLFENIKIPFANIADENVLRMPLSLKKMTRACGRLFRSYRSVQEFTASLKDSVRRGMRNVLANRAFYLFVCRGCLGKCAYCGIRYAIGKLKSKEVAVVEKEFERGLAAGYQDYFVLGDDTGAYGRDIGSSLPVLLSDLTSVQEKYNHLPGMKRDVELNGARFFLEDVHPRWVILYSDQLVNIFAGGKIASLLCPIESGSNRVLNLMRRQYRIEEFMEAMWKIKGASPTTHFSTQIIVGFPSESERDLEETLGVLERSPFEDVTIFAYHDKEGAQSSRMSGKIGEEEIDARIRTAINLLNENNIKVHLSCA